jgi:hypothetical protein
MKAANRVSWRSRRATVGFYIALFMIAIIVERLTAYINSAPYLAAPIDPQTLSRALDSYAAIGNLLTTLATGLLAGMAWFFTNRPKQGYPAHELWPVAAGALCACLSIWFGYVGSQNLTFAIQHSIKAGSSILQTPRIVQMVSLLFGVCFFADFLRRDLTAAVSPALATGPSTASRSGTAPREKVS